MNEPMAVLNAPTRKNARARQSALAAMAEVEVHATSLVSYTSGGSLLIIAGPEDFEALKPALGDLPCVHSPMLHRLEGHLGAFQAYVQTDGGERSLALLKGDGSDSFDLVLDLGRPAYWQQDMPPLGYYRAADVPSARLGLEQLKELKGEFEKPKFFEYSEDICAHGRRGQEACSRCLDACPAQAISSLAERISVDPYLCQGGGSCATVCPTGAIRYAYPRLNDNLKRLRRLMQEYRKQQGRHPTLLIHDSEAGQAWVEVHQSRLGDHVLPFMVEEVASVGMDTWLSALAFSAYQVVVLVHPDQDMMRSVLREQMDYARGILQGMGYAGERIVLLDSEAAVDSLVRPASLEGGDPDFPVAAFMLLDEKRYAIRSAVEHLYQYAPVQEDAVALPAGAPFGQVLVDTQSCTLCMACVAVCPAQALSDGNDVPRLNFHETSCVQCGLCSQSCPERAITLQSRYLFRDDWAQQQRILHEEEPFCCTSCGKPFATRSAIERVQSRLSGHAMFQSEEQQRRLFMCEDCRVRDMFGNEMDGRP